jgi:O-antigen/teichoic acid export membrane protein
VLTSAPPRGGAHRAGGRPRTGSWSARSQSWLEGRPPKGAHAAVGWRRRIGTRLSRSAMASAMVRTAGFNILATGTASLAGVILARAVGPSVRGEYAAITAWFGVVTMVGGLGQPAALCFYVARDPARAPAYVASSRTIMVVAGFFAIAAGLALSPVLGHGQAPFVTGYRVAFVSAIVASAASAYIYSLQAVDLHQWNQVRAVQPVLALLAMAALWLLGWLSLESALLVVAGSMLAQLGWAYWCCRRAGLAPGRTSVALIRPLSRYGIAQIAALTPGTLNAQLDQIVLSQTVPSAQLGCYAIAVSLSLLPLPVVSAIGYVAFPRLAAQRAATGATGQLVRLAILGSAGITAAIMLPIALGATWAIPLVFGSGYASAVPLLWILTPGAVFLACGQVAGDLLRGRNRPGAVAWAQGFAAVFTIALLLALLPVVGVYGAAIASTIAYGMALAAMLRCLRGGQAPPRERAAGHRRRPLAATGIPD